MMLHKTRGIVLSYVRYKDSSIIVRVFTEEFGLRSYIVNGVRKKNKGNKLIFFQPLSLLELIVYENEKRSINRISEMRFAHRPESIPFDVKKSAIALFLCEFLERLIVEEDPNLLFFEYIYEHLVAFDNKSNQVGNFHIVLLIGLTKIHGIGISQASELIMEGDGFPISDLVLANINAVLKDPRHPMSGFDRREMLLALINYYHVHFGTMKNIKSLKVLSEIF